MEHGERRVRERAGGVLGLRVDSFTYFDYHHTIDDTFDKIDPEAIAQNVAAYAAITYWAAETPTNLTPAPAPTAPGGGR